MPTQPLASNTMSAITEQPDSARPTMSLKRMLATGSLLAVAVGMILSVALEYAVAPPEHSSELFTHHLFPAALIGLIVWITLGLVLNRTIIEPVRRIFAHLYQIGCGRLAPLEMKSRIEEIDTVVDGINILVHRLKESPDDAALGKACDDLGRLRADLKAVVDTSGRAERFLPVMRDLHDLEGDLLSVAQNARQGA